VRSARTCVVSVSYRGAADTVACVRSLLASRGPGRNRGSGYDSKRSRVTSCAGIVSIRDPDPRRRKCRIWAR